MEPSFLDQVPAMFHSLDLSSLGETLKQLEGTSAYVTIFGVLLACGLGLPMPEDITIVTAGYLAHKGNIDLVFGMLTCMMGVLAGDFVLFSLGRLLGPTFFSLPGVKFLFKPEQLEKAREKLRTNAKKICFTARFMAGLRAPIYLSAGMLGVKPTTFVFMDTLAALLSVPALTYVGYHFGSEIEAGFAYLLQAKKYVAIGLVLLISGFIFYRVKKSKEIKPELPPELNPKV
jgi:membrane protein DedA with SNARE-associated domain